MLSRAHAVDPGLHTSVPRAHWIALLCALLIACGLLLALGWSGAWRPSLDEKRVLATRPALPHTLAQVRAYPKAFDAYVHDQFPPRAQLIAGLNYLRYLLGYSGSSRVVVGRHGWLFYDNGNHIEYPPASSPLSATDLDVWTSVFAAHARYLASRGIAYAVLVAPARENLYPDRLPHWSYLARAGRTGDLDAILAALRSGGMDASRVRSCASCAHVTCDQRKSQWGTSLCGVIDLRPAFAAAIAHGQRLYTPFDIHWNGLGAYLGYRALLQTLSSRYPQLQPRPLRDFPVDRVSGLPRDLALMLGIAGFVHQDYPQFLAPPPPSPASVRYLGKRVYWTEPRVVSTGFPGPRLLLTMDSFSNALLPFLLPHFSQIVIAHNQDGYFREDLIERFHPDIVLLEVFEPSLRFSMNSTVAAASAAAQPLPRFVELPASAVIPTAALDCNLEQASLLAPTSRQPHPSRDLLLAGWAAQVARQRSAPQVRIVLRSPQAAYAVVLPVNLVRADVSEHFHRNGIALSGFAARADLTGVRPGRYAVAVEQSFADGDAICRTASTLAIQ